MGSISLEASTPLVVKVQLPTSVETFSDLARVTATMRYFDNIEIESIVRTESELRFRRGGHAKVLHFSTSSPPVFTVLTDPQWLILFVTLIIGYDRIGRNVREIADDARRVTDSFCGLSEQKRLELETGVRYLYTELLARGERAADDIARRLGERRRRLFPDDWDPRDFTVEVTDLDDWERQPRNL